MAAPATDAKEGAPTSPLYSSLRILRRCKSHSRPGAQAAQRTVGRCPLHSQAPKAHESSPSSSCPQPSNDDTEAAHENAQRQ
jgi:hypothetical protein